jgi:hypothetical protein
MELVPTMHAPPVTCIFEKSLGRALLDMTSPTLTRLTHAPTQKATRLRVLKPLYQNKVTFRVVVYIVYTKDKYAHMHKLNYKYACIFLSQRSIFYTMRGAAYD